VNDRRNSNHDDPLERATRAYHTQEVPDGPPPEFVAEMLTALQQAEEAGGPAGNSDLTPRSFSMSRLVKYAVAATILIALVGMTAWLVPGRGSALAFERVAEAIANIRSATCELSSEQPEGKSTTKGQVMFLAPSRERQEIVISAPGKQETGMTIRLCDAEHGRILSLAPEQKLAVVAEIKNVPVDKQTNSFERMRKLVSNARKGEVDEIEELGRLAIAGREAIGFRIVKGNSRQTIWADPETALPIRVEFENRTEPKYVHVWSDFRINVELDESLFSMDIPEGYTVVNASMDASVKPNAMDLVPALRLVAERNDGKFPPSLRNSDDLTRPVYIKERDDEEAVKKLLVEVMPKITGAVTFLGTQLTPESDWHYAGKGVMIDTPDRPIYWYRPDPKTDYTVIYADLSVKQVSAADLPKITGSLSTAEEPAKP
jgi:outer membrane lipoprotein-sorting protein